MSDIRGIVERLLNEKLKKKFALFDLDVKELNEKSRDLKKKYDLLNARVRKIEQETNSGTDYGV